MGSAVGIGQMVSTERVTDLLSREALFLDQKMWEDWLDLYAEDAVY